MGIMLTLSRRLRTILLLVSGLAVLIVPAIASAATTAKDKTTNDSSDSRSGSAVTQGYGTDTPLQLGMIVKLKDSDSTKVEAVTQATANKVLGVVVAANAAPVTLSSDNNNGQVFVATFGRYDVLVSNQNGPIKIGDYIVLSALSGIGMKVDAHQPVVIGKAAAGFGGSNNVAGSATLKDSAGKTINVSIGRIPVDLNIGHNPLQQISAKNVPSFLQQVSQGITGKQVGVTRIYLALIVLLVSAFIAGGMLYSGIRGGLIAIGRNPLAKKEIIRGILRVVLSGLIVFIIGLFGVYLLLKL